MRISGINRAENRYTVQGGHPDGESYKALLWEKPIGEIVAKRTYKIIRNPHTGSFLRNKEVYCGHCFENFGDQFTLEIHRPDDGNLESKCTPPKRIPLTPQRNFSGAVVWRVTF